MAVPVPLNATGLRSRLLFYTLPARLRPTLAQHPLLCPHGNPRVFDVDNATQRFGDVYAWVECAPCANGDPNSDGIRRLTWLTKLSQEKRAEIAFTVNFLGYLSDVQTRGLISNVENRLGVVAGAREITLHLFVEPELPAIVHRFVVPSTSQFSLKDSPLFELSNAAASPPTVYDRYELVEDEFTPNSGVLDTIDISNLGNTLIYKRTGIRDRDCPELCDLRMWLQLKHYGSSDGRCNGIDDPLVQSFFEHFPRSSFGSFKFPPPLSFDFVSGLPNQRRLTLRLRVEFIIPTAAHHAYSRRHFLVFLVSFLRFLTEAAAFVRQTSGTKQLVSQSLLFAQYFSFSLLLLCVLNFMAPRKLLRQTPAQKERSIIRAQVRARNREKRLRATELIRLREAAADAFEADFGPLDVHDSLDYHFESMLFHASLAADLALRFNNDEASIIAEAAKPISFTVANPFSENDPRQLALEACLREWKQIVEGPDVSALPATINIDFPFHIHNVSATRPGIGLMDYTTVTTGYYLGVEL
ncbi:hypothetical protein C8F04DRAFT_1181926 [Mycena alexandri]|uniref:Uncharacterized protein n=1 Tax=Mycena alexandri TaxID=1745969 RepID=A0AAD6SYQ2_9AGAR|nr:hypothetical protein C8F04DRAFT_1181926 [Mycena alexandri]